MESNTNARRFIISLGGTLNGGDAYSTFVVTIGQQFPAGASLNYLRPSLVACAEVTLEARRGVRSWVTDSASVREVQ